MSITFEELVKKFGIVPVTPYGPCIIVPGTEFDPDWEDQLSREGCRFHFVDIAGKPVTLVQKGKDQEEEDAEEQVIKSPEKPQVEEEIAKHDILWGENDDKLLISLWNAKVKVPAIRAKFPGRPESFLRKRIRLLQKQGRIQSRWKKKRGIPPKTYSDKHWSDKDKDLLIKLWNEHVTVSKIAENFPNRTEHAVKMCVGRLREAGIIQLRIPGRKRAEEPNTSKREKVEKKEQSTPTEIQTSIPTQIPTHAPIEPPAKEDSALTLLKKIRDLLAPRDFTFDYYCRSCGESGNVSNSERIWEFCPVCGKPLLIANVEEFSS